jgi:hypothetical protein
VAASFPFDEPNKRELDRNKYMEENYDEDKLEIKGWGDSLCGDKEVWEKLSKYYLENYKEFA